jgi:hypothetical protein
MSKESKEILKTILSNTELIMAKLNIKKAATNKLKANPVKRIKKSPVKKTSSKE